MIDNVFNLLNEGKDYYEEDFIGKTQNINKFWKNYWNSRQQTCDPTLKREIRKEKALLKKILNQKTRRYTKQQLKTYYE